jgi:hypothetical protein
MDPNSILSRVDHQNGRQFFYDSAMNQWINGILKGSGSIHHLIVAPAIGLFQPVHQFRRTPRRH